MAVDFGIVEAPEYRVASVVRLGPWASENMMRPFFSRISAWARKNKVKTGKWILTELIGPTAPSEKRMYEESIEIKGRRKSDLPKETGRIKMQRLPSTTVARIKFNPELVSSGLVYHGLESWLEWRMRFGEYERSRIFGRERYTKATPGSPRPLGRMWKFRCQLRRSRHVFLLQIWFAFEGIFEKVVYPYLNLPDPFRLVGGQLQISALRLCKMYKRASGIPMGAIS